MVNENQQPNPVNTTNSGPSSDMMQTNDSISNLTSNSNREPIHLQNEHIGNGTQAGQNDKKTLQQILMALINPNLSNSDLKQHISNILTSNPTLLSSSVVGEWVSFHFGQK